MVYFYSYLYFLGSSQYAPPYSLHATSRSSGNKPNSSKSLAHSPQQHNEVPQRHNELPQQHNELPQQHNELPQQHNKLPQQHKEYVETHKLQRTGVSFYEVADWLYNESKQMYEPTIRRIVIIKNTNTQLSIALLCLDARIFRVYVFFWCFHVLFRLLSSV